MRGKVKFITWLVLGVILILSGFQRFTLSQPILILAGMWVIISLFDDLAEFNLWGFRGRSKEQEFKDAQAATGESIELPRGVDQKDFEDSLKEPLQLMHPDVGNFLALAFEIERLLRIYTSAGSLDQIPKNTSFTRMLSNLHAEGAITDAGLERLKAVNWLRNKIVHGGLNEVTEKVLNEGFEMAKSFYEELYAEMFPSNT